MKLNQKVKVEQVDQEHGKQEQKNQEDPKQRQSSEESERVQVELDEAGVEYDDEVDAEVFGNHFESRTEIKKGT